MVPALTLILATLAAFPAFNDLRASLQNAIVVNLVPDTGLKISETLTNFVDAVGKLTFFGVPDVALTAVFNDLRAGLFIAPTEDGRWVLSRDLERTALADLVHHFGLGLNHNFGDEDLKAGELGKRLGQYLRNAAESERTL